MDSRVIGAGLAWRVLCCAGQVRRQPQVGLYEYIHRYVVMYM